MTTQTDTVLFEEEQVFRQTWLWALLIGILVVLTVALGAVVFQAPKQANVLPAVMGLGFGIVVEVGALAFMYILKLHVRVDARKLHVQFYPLVKRDIAWTEIAHWEVRTYRPLMEYGGWGVRCGWNGMAYNVSGNRGVQLELTDGKRLLIGSLRPEELADAIQRAKQTNAS